jgi:hypothetical protein
MHDTALRNTSSERGVAPVLLLFAMSAFSVLSVASLTTPLGSAPAGQTFGILKAMPEEALTKYVAQLVVPRDWREAGQSGTLRFQLPVLVPDNGGTDIGSSAAWHTMTEVPGLAVCCEARPGVCARRTEGTSAPAIIDWTPRTDDTLAMSFDLASRPDDSTPAAADLVTATKRTAEAAAIADGTTVACQLEFDGQVIAKGIAHLQQTSRSGTTTQSVAGTLHLQVKTK